MMGLLLANDRTGRRLAMMTLRGRGELGRCRDDQGGADNSEDSLSHFCSPFHALSAQRGPEIWLRACTVRRADFDSAIAPIAPYASAGARYPLRSLPKLW